MTEAEIIVANGGAPDATFVFLGIMALVAVAGYFFYRWTSGDN